MRPLKTALTRFKSRSQNLLPSGEYDLAGMHQRACDAIAALDYRQDEISRLMGIDTSIPLYQRQNPLPTAENIAKVTQILGISVRFLLYGEPQNDIDRLVLSQGKKSTVAESITNSTVVQNVQAENITVQNFTGGLNQTETEMLLLLRSLPPRQKIDAINALLSISEG